MKKVLELKELDLSKLNVVKTPDINDLLCSNKLFNSLIYNIWVDEQDEFHKNIKQYTVYTWYCIDSIVGIDLFTLNGELLCYSSQNGRKSTKEFKYFSKEMYYKLEQHYKDYVLKLVESGDEDDIVI